MLKRTFKKNDNEDENVFWVTMTDLLLGLTMVFVTLFVLAMTGFTQTKLTQQQTQSDVAKVLNETLKENNIEASVDAMTGQVDISDLELFEVNSYKLSKNGEQYLDKFVPIYVNTIFSDTKLAKKILNVSIQGHTDSQTFKNVNSKEAQFVKNMELSLKRANAVEEYIFKTKYDKKFTDLLLKKLVVEGKSYTEPVFVNGKEDYAKSRRVELKLFISEASPNDFLVKQ